MIFNQKAVYIGTLILSANFAEIVSANPSSDTITTSDGRIFTNRYSGYAHNVWGKTLRANKALGDCIKRCKEKEKPNFKSKSALETFCIKQCQGAGLVGNMDGVKSDDWVSAPYG